MIKHDVEQGSSDWYSIRMGIPTASNFHKIVVPSTGEISRSKDKKRLADKVREYAYFLAAEKLLNRPLETFSNTEWMERGKEMEPTAVKVYELTNEVKTEAVGFITTNDGLIGCSPDRLIVGKSAGIEIKCPAPQTHICYLAEGFGDDYLPQVQGQLYVAEMEYADKFSFHPEMPPYQERTKRDEVYITNLHNALAEFNDFLFSAIKKLKDTGLFTENNKVLSPHEMVYNNDDIQAAHEATKVIQAG